MFQLAVQYLRVWGCANNSYWALRPWPLRPFLCLLFLFKARPLQPERANGLTSCGVTGYRPLLLDYHYIPVDAILHILCHVTGLFLLESYDAPCAIPWFCLCATHHAMRLLNQLHAQRGMAISNFYSNFDTIVSLLDVLVNSPTVAKDKNVKISKYQNIKISKYRFWGCPTYFLFTA